MKVPEEKETIKMCKEMDEIIKESNEKVAAISKAEGKFETCVQLVNDGDISLDIALERLHMSLDEFYKKKAKFESK